MPELPDLQYLVKNLSHMICGTTVTSVKVSEPIVIRMVVPKSFEQALAGEQFVQVVRHGPFINFKMTTVELIVHAMLAGRYHLEQQSAKKMRGECFAIYLDDGRILHYSDTRRMGKAYVTQHGAYDSIPGYLTQGVNIVAQEFTLPVFRAMISKTRKQVRVFLMDQTSLSAIGNAYADEILFSAGIHPKTFCNKLTRHDSDRLYACIGNTIQWGIEKVEAAGQPLEVKVREHMRVRGRKGMPCPNCAATIRREQVYGYDTYFCPTCQPATRKQFITWS